MDGIFSFPMPKNEPVLNYAPGSEERKALEKMIATCKETQRSIPIIIGGRRITTTSEIGGLIVPHNLSRSLGSYLNAGRDHVEMAVASSVRTHKEWSRWSFEDRASVFLKAADLLSDWAWRMRLNAATMLCQSKTVYQAEIDAACELIDFLRFNVHFAEQIYRMQPISSPCCRNKMQYRPLEGFVFAITPFNFTSIAGNLPTAPALMGNTVVWKPASTAVYSAYLIMLLLEEAGLPPGVINMISGPGSEIGPLVLSHPDLAGVHFTGSTDTFLSVWTTIGAHVRVYKNYPRLVGETGGKDFIFVHESADIDEVVTAIVRGAFEYQGQKCSAASRVYVPKCLWTLMKGKLIKEVKKIKMGDPEDFTNFMCAVIDRVAFKKITGYIEDVRKSEYARILVGGNYDDSVGYFIEPTVILTEDSKFKTMKEEIFGPVVTVFVYDESMYASTLHVANETSPYALTGAIFARDRKAIDIATAILEYAAGNFYINDKPAGAVVGQQPFGGARASGTNDKAGSMLNLLRWVSPRTIKENFVPPTEWRYPHMGG